MNLKNNITCLLAFILTSTGTQAQGTVEDYLRAYSLYDKFNATRVYDDPADIRWEDDSVFHYFSHTAEGRTYYIGKVDGDIATADIQTVNMEALATLLTRETGKEIKRKDLQLARFGTDKKHHFPLWRLQLED